MIVIRKKDENTNSFEKIYDVVRQIELLEADEIPCPGGKVDLTKYQWRAAAVGYIPGEGYVE